MTADRTNAARQRKHYARRAAELRAKGYVRSPSIWVHRDDWPRVRAYAEKLEAERERGASG